MARLSRPAGLSRLNVVCFLALLLFVSFIFIPPVYVLSYAFKTNFTLDEAGEAALVNSLVIGVAITLLDLTFGLPVAWVMARRRNLRFRHLFDTLIDMPLVVPTSVLGLSAFYFWGGGVGGLLGVEGGLIGKGPVLVALLHVVFTFPYVVRSIEAAVFQIDRTHEQAATMLGAPPLTVFRTISLPLFRKGVISGAILAFTRSISETGATMMVAGLFSTAPTMVVEYKKASDIPSAAAVSVVLIVAAVLLLVSTKLLSGGFRVPVFRVWPREERILGRRYVGLRNAVVSFAVLAVILLPTFYIVLTGLDTVNGRTFSELMNDQTMVDGIVLSFAVGFIVTALNLLLAIPMGLLIARNMFHAGGAVDTLSDIILMVPTSALGLSLSLFWGNLAFNELLVLILAHLSFTFPLMLKPISAAFSGVDPSLEDAARTLGAGQTRVFRTVVYPLVRPGVVAGIIMTFMRSLSETGATLSVSERIKTVPVLLVDLFARGEVEDKTVLACVILFAISFAFIILLKRSDASKNAAG